MKKDLHQMTVEELGRLFPIIITDYNSKWPVYYEKEKQLLLSIFNPDDIKIIEHIGSTAIPGIKAKPTIDILIVMTTSVADQTIIENIKSLGYHYIFQPENPPPHMLFVKGYTTEGFKGLAYHIHIRHQVDNDEIIFRDYLKSHPEKAREYESLKVNLSQKHKNNREDYTNAKSGFVQSVLKTARKEK